MTTHSVVFTQQAARELEAIAEWWAEHRSVQQAALWYEGFSAKIETLCDEPDRLRRKLSIQADKKTTDDTDVTDKKVSRHESRIDPQRPDSAVVISAIRAIRGSELIGCGESCAV